MMCTPNGVMERIRSRETGNEEVRDEVGQRFEDGKGMMGK